MIEASLNEQNLWLIIADMGTSEEEEAEEEEEEEDEEGERNLEYFQGQKLFCLRSFLRERASKGRDKYNGVAGLHIFYPSRVIPTDLRARTSTSLSDLPLL